LSGRASGFEFAGVDNVFERHEPICPPWRAQPPNILERQLTKGRVYI
jgi:hypothetical protein